MSDATAEQEPAEQRAAEAAEALAAEGAAVTGRAVRARSGVRMSVAAEAARKWNEGEARAGAVPEPSPAVAARFTALWREAVTAARGEFEQARVGWQEKVRQADAERIALSEEVELLETQRDQARQDADAALEQAAGATESLSVQRSRADKAEASIEAMSGERGRLIAERDRLQSELEDGRTALAAARQEAAVAKNAADLSARNLETAETKAAELGTALAGASAARDEAERAGAQYQAEAAAAAGRALSASTDATKAVQDLNKEQGRREHAEAEAARLRRELAEAQESIRTLKAAKQKK